MDNHFVLGIAAFTTAPAYLFGKRALRFSASAFRRALRQFIECVGAFVVFLSVNLAVGVALIFAIRSFTPRFISPYVLVEDLTLVILSAVQAVLFRLWWQD